MFEGIRVFQQRWPSAVSTATDEPVFVLASCWRSGSTLLQRMLMHRCFIWGEPFGQTGLLEALAAPLRGIRGDWPPDDVFIDQPIWAGDLSDKWVADLYPAPDRLIEAHVQFFRTLFAVPPAWAGLTRWGFKEVRLGVDFAFYLKWLFPKARFLFLIRNPYDCWGSYRQFGETWHRYWPNEPLDTPEKLGEHWRDLTSGFLERHQDVGGMLLRYEQLLAGDFDPGPVNDYLGFELNLDVRSLVLSGRRTPVQAVPTEETERFHAVVGDVASRLGYVRSPSCRINEPALDSEQESKGIMQDVTKGIEQEDQMIQELTAYMAKKDREIQALVIEVAQKIKDMTDLNRQSEERQNQIRALEEELAQSRDQGLALGTQLTVKDQTLRTLAAQLDELRDDRQALQSQLVEKGEVLRMVAAQLERSRDDLQASESQLAEKRQTLQALTSQLEESREHRQALRLQLAEKDQALWMLAAQLESIHGSTGWALLNGLYRVRFRLLPRGTRRERWGRYGMRVLRKFRQGPRATLKSVARRFRLSIADSQSQNHVLGSRSSIANRKSEITNQECLEVPGLVSIILPVYNQADLLRDSIQSVLAQTYEHFELIVLNDGSTDGVERVLDEFAGHPKVRLLSQANQKLPKALSNAFEFARGEFWTWTSADNLMHPEQLAKQVAFLRRSPEIAMVYADYLAIDDRGKPLCDASFRPHNRRTPDSAEIHLPRSTETLNNVQDNFIGACFMYRGWVGRLLGEYDPSLGVEDYDYWMRLNAHFKIAHLGTDEVLYQYRVHDNSLNGRAVELKILERVQWLMRYEEERYAYYRKPWRIYADRNTEHWLRREEAAPHAVSEWPGGVPLAPAGGKTMLLIEAESLPDLAACPPPQETFVAVWFAGTSDLPYRQRMTLQRFANVCFAADNLTASRLRLFTKATFEVPPGKSLFDIALAYGNNHRFYDTTRPSDLRSRQLPEVYIPQERRLRILLQVDNFTQGGLEQVMLDVAAVLRDGPFEVKVLVLGQQGQAAAKARETGITVLTLPATDREAHYRRLLAEEHIDLVNAHYSLFGAKIAAELRIPFVQTIHNTYVWFTPEQVAAYQAHDSYTTAYACVSNSVAHYADVRLGLPVNKMVVVPNGVDMGRLREAEAMNGRQRLRHEFRLAADDFVFLNVASVYGPKAQREMVKALAQIASSCPRAKLVFLGRVMDAAYMEQLERSIHTLKLEDAVVFAGHHEDVASFYDMAHAFLLPSFWEGWSLALAEAVCAGLPIVASDVGAAQEVLSQTGGELVPTPFASITELDSTTINRYLGAEQTGFVTSLAQAMQRTYTRPVPPVVSEAFRHRVDHGNAYAAYAQLFQWLIQGGDPASARVWLSQRNDQLVEVAERTSGLAA